MSALCRFAAGHDGRRDAGLRQGVEHPARCRARLLPARRGAAHLCEPGKEGRDDEPLGCVCGHERDLVDSARLTEPIHPSGPLLEPRWIPRQLVVNHHAAPMMEVQTL